MYGIEEFDGIVGMDLQAAVAEVTHNAIMINALPHNTPGYSKHDKTQLIDALIRRLETVKLRINLEMT